jgi:hypothetical protein
VDNEADSDLVTINGSVYGEFLKALDSQLVPLFDHITDDGLEVFRVAIPFPSNLILVLIWTW